MSRVFGSGGNFLRRVNNIFPNGVDPRPYSIRVVFMPTGGGTDQMLFSEGFDDGNAKISLYLGNSPDFRVGLSGIGNFIGQTTYPDNTWHQFVVTHGADGQIFLYKNDQVIASGTRAAPSDIVLTPGSHLGGVVNGFNTQFVPFIGRMALFAVWDSVLTAGQITELWGGGTALKLSTEVGSPRISLPMLTNTLVEEVGDQTWQAIGTSFSADNPPIATSSPTFDLRATSTGINRVIDRYTRVERPAAGDFYVSPTATPLGGIPVYEQNFTGTNGTAVNVLAPQTGSGNLLTSFGTVQVQNGRAVATSAPAYIQTPVQSTSNYTIETILYPLASSSDISIVARDGAAGSYYVSVQSNFISLFRYDAGTDTDVPIGTPWSWSRPVNTNVNVQLSCSGSLISVSVDGTVRITATDATYTDPGRASVYFDTNGSVSTGTHLDLLRILTGSNVANGTINSPWSLTTALSGPPSVTPGSTVWLRGGTYTGDFVSTITGSATRPVVFRQYPGERATIDGRLQVDGPNVWFWGMEVMYSNPARIATTPGSDPPEVPREGKTIFVTAPNVKFIGMVIHDLGDGLFGSVSSSAMEVDSCIVYNVGWLGPDRGHGHLIYLQNDGPPKVIHNNVFFNSFGQGIHIYGSESTRLRNFIIEGNTVFNAGVLAIPTHSIGANLIAYGGAGGFLGDIRLRENSFFHTSQSAQAFQINVEGADPGYNLIFRDNIVYGQPFFAEWTGSTVTGNRFIGAPGFTGQDALQRVVLDIGQNFAVHVWDNNQYVHSNTSADIFLVNRQPSGYERRTFTQWRNETGYDANSTFVTASVGLQVIVRKSVRERGRYLATVWNWNNAASASIDIGEVVPSGSIAQVRHVYDPYGPPLTTITSGQSSASVSLESRTPPTPIGVSTSPAGTGRLLNVFVITRVPV